MRTTEAKCGCRQNEREWVSKCPQHEAEDRAVAARWAADRVKANPGTRYTDDYLLLAAEHDPTVLDTAWMDAGVPA